MGLGDCRLSLSQYDGDVGDLVRVTARFFDASDAAADPDSVTMTSRDPAGTETALAVSSTETGIHYADVAIDASGRWWFRAAGTGAVDAAAERSLLIRASAFDAP